MIFRLADVCLCLGTSLQIFPCANFPLLTKKSGGRIAVVNLQATRVDNRADLVIHERVDVVMEKASYHNLIAVISPSLCHIGRHNLAVL